MDVRLFPDGRAFVRNHVVPVDAVGNDTAGSFIVPLDKDQVDINSIQVSGLGDPIYLSVDSLSVVSRGNDDYVGKLITYTDNYAVISQGRSRVVVRNYDNITDSQYIIGRTSSGIVPDELVLSYVTSGINANVVHSLDISSQQLESDLNVKNDTFNDLVDAQFEVITAEQATPVFAFTRTQHMEVETSAAAAPKESSAGTIYVIDGTYNIPAGYTVSIPLIRNSIQSEILYVIDAPNGQQNATYTLRWISPVDLPPGSLYVYRGGNLEATGSLSSTGEGQRRSIPLLVIPSVYARGTVSRTDAEPATIQLQNGSVRTTNGNNVTIATVNLKGTVTNSLSDEITVLLRYFVGSGKVNIASNYQAEREDNYIVFPLVLEPRSSRSYDINFTIMY